MSTKKRCFIYALLLLIALGFRLFIALRLPNDEPDDGRLYSQIARNILEQHVYSIESQAPYTPTLIRLPGYPLFIAAIYSVFGHGNNTAVRVAQAVIDTATCILIALVAFQWAPNERKHRAVLIALVLAAVCPFTTIYVATILTEVATNFLAVAMVLTATFAFKSTTRKRAIAWWIATGLIAGLNVFFRPDSGLFAAAIGLTLMLPSLLSFRKFREATLYAAIFSVAFCIVLVPWTSRNRRLFHVFQPLAPAHAEMPGEFVPHGYLLWVRTWLDDERYVAPALWAMDTRQIHVEDFPARAFDSKEERDRVEALFEKYNHPDGEESEQADEEQSAEDQSSEDDSSGDEEDQPEEEPEPEEHPEPA